MSQRLLSIDVFRGLAIAFMIVVNTPGSWSYVYAPLRHADWHGCTPTDLVFPFFIFAIGLSMAFSFSKFSERPAVDLIKKVVKRSALIFLVGFLLNWFPFYTKSMFDVRFFGVLQRIAMSYLLAGIVVAVVRKENLLGRGAYTALIVYALLIVLMGNHTLEGNIHGKIDLLILPEKNLYGGFGLPFDPEGLIGSISAAAQILLGYFFGMRLKKHWDNPQAFIKKTIVFILAFLLLAIVGNSWIPINKPLWTSTFVLYSSAWSLIVLCLLVFLLDMKKWNKWSFPLKIFGMNSLFSFVLAGVLARIMYLIDIGDKTFYSFFYESVFKALLGNYLGSLSFALFVTGVVFGFAYILYRKQIWIKL